MSASPWIPAALLLLLLPGIIRSQSVADPAPPKVQQVAKDAKRPAPMPHEFLTFTAAPRPLSPQAVAGDWPRFLGPTDNAQSPETHLTHQFSQGGPPKIWEIKKGEGYTSPAISGDSLVFFHAREGSEIIECLHPETGQRYWKQEYPALYQDRFGYANGPRGSPVISKSKVVTLGVTCVLTCCDLQTGTVLWRRNLQSEFDVPQEFFGYGSTPLIMGDKVIINVGGRSPQLSVGAFDLETGKLVWGLDDAWGASYASPIPAEIHGKKVVLVFAGGESKPATGGLLCLDPETGKLHDRFPWRADDYISVNATSPVVLTGTNRVFVSTAYPKGRRLGGVVVEFDKNLKAREVWRSSKFALHWMNPVYHEGHLYGIDGETERQARLVCVDATNGEEKWRKDLTWEDTEMAGGRPAVMGTQRASLLRVDGSFLCLGENGTLLWLDLTPEKAEVVSKTQLFYAPHTWCLPALSRGLVYVTQNYEEQVRGKTGERILCFDLRKADP